MYKCMVTDLIGNVLMCESFYFSISCFKCEMCITFQYLEILRRLQLLIAYEKKNAEEEEEEK